MSVVSVSHSFSKDVILLLSRTKLKDNYYLWMMWVKLFWTPFAECTYTFFRFDRCCDLKKCMIQNDFVRSGRIEECFNEAVVILKSMDILLVGEWMNDIRTELYVNRLFFGNDTANYVRMKDVFTRPTTMKGEQRRGSNLMIDAQVRKQLINQNEWDLRLFDYARRIVFERTTETKPWTDFSHRTD